MPPRIVTIFLIALAFPSIALSDDVVDYLRDIKPLLKSRCYSCHGGLKQKSGLRVDTVSSLLKGSESGLVVNQSEIDKSPLLERIASTNADIRMPPEHEGEPLSASQVDLIRRWIIQGASGPADESPDADPREHWAFKQRSRPTIPDQHRLMDKSVAWDRNPIDSFVATVHQRHGLTPQSEAGRLIMVRRLYVDLIGLPPSTEDIDLILSMNSDDWYEQTVDRLLEDPRHGERWARHWMDVWRYSDWWGLGDQLRNSQKHIWHWRDWIVESLNENLPYDEMIRLMLAADELHPNDLEKLRASGFLARNYFLFNRNQWMDETIEHVCKGFLGLTMNCAKCHDHKYDPFTQTNYYELRAIFEPYHVRTDVMPHQSDLNLDGVPRAYDGHLDLPTYVYIRGNEANPDKSVAIKPAVPSFLDSSPFEIQQVALPIESWQPDRRQWVIDANLSVAQTKLDSILATPHDSAEVETVKLSHEVTRTEYDCLKLRIAAMKARWAKSDAASNDGISPESMQTLERAEKESAEAASRSERQLAVLRAKLAIADAEAKVARAADDKKEAAQKELKTVQESHEKATKLVEETSDKFTGLIGAAWTPTRFFDSTKDDPTVTFPSKSSGRRTALAKWITDPRNPLTARVAVNQIWMRHMGRPLVPTVFDFGRKGTPPNHPALLDWLASELVDSQWNMKHLHRLIVTSATYRMNSSNTHSSSNGIVDPDNDWWWRRQPIRLESQVVRDSILSLAGRIDLSLGGPSISAKDQSNSHRRSLYFYHSNNDRNLFLTTFDDATVKDCYRREQSIVPQQALALTNSQLVLDASLQIAERLTTSRREEASNEMDETMFVRSAFRTILGFEPNDAEITASRKAMDAWRLKENATGSSVRANLVWALLNHNDFVTLR